MIRSTRASLWQLVVLAALLVCPALACAQTAVDLGRLTGPVAAPIKKQVRTLRDLRFRDLTPQRYDFSCGSAALATLLEHGYGIETNETDLIKHMLVGADAKDVVKNGFSMLDMKRYVSTIGMRAHGFKIEPDALYRLQMPVIALLDLKGYKHFVVVKGAAAGRVFIADPALGHRVMPEADFVRGWNNVVLAIVADRPMRTDSYLLNSRTSPALARRVDALDRATSPPRLVEFGLVYADLF
ncbi:C39 family peptidase [Cognatilysobacter bugurensis]|uniref:C39 family peptidase n=1 Tax=Cognatilysobacter bugurensis TaxID=543356 RepID=UPI0016744FC8|nr:C39 family peptidase [Lysobacter bugurensis]